MDRITQPEAVGRPLIKQLEIHVHRLFVYIIGDAIRKRPAECNLHRPEGGTIGGQLLLLEQLQVFLQVLQVLVQSPLEEMISATKVPGFHIYRYDPNVVTFSLLFCRCYCSTHSFW